MRRRSFLATLGVGLTGLVLDPERLLWVPGQRTFFLPAAPLCPSLSISQIVAVTYEKVLKERRVLWEDREWFDCAFRRECERIHGRCRS